MKKFVQLCVLGLIVPMYLSINGCSGSEDKNGEYTVEKNLKVEATINSAKAEAGKKIFTEKCAACHKLDTKFVGPPLREVAKRRSFEYIVSQIMHPELMIKNNDTTKVLLTKYLTQMPNQHLSIEEAMSVLEYLREVSLQPANQ